MILGNNQRITPDNGPYKTEGQNVESHSTLKKSYYKTSLCESLSFLPIFIADMEELDFEDTGHDESSRVAKIAVFGVQGVGKSALTVRLITKRYISEYFSGLDSSYSHALSIDGREVQLNIVDKSGQGNEEELIRWADGFVLVYSVTNRRSFEELTRLKDLIDQYNGKTTSPGARRYSAVSTSPIVLVANKTDMSAGRQVTTVEGLKLARDFNCAFFEVSASEQIEPIISVFHYLAKNIIGIRGPLTPPPRKVRSTSGSNSSATVKKLLSSLSRSKSKGFRSKSV